MNKELTPLEALKELFDIAYDKVRSGWEDKPLERKLFVLNDIIEKALKKQKRKLDLIGEVLVDASKGNYTDLNDSINEIREVLGYE